MNKTPQITRKKPKKAKKNTKTQILPKIEKHEKSKKKTRLRPPLHGVKGSKKKTAVAASSLSGIAKPATVSFSGPMQAHPQSKSSICGAPPLGPSGSPISEFIDDTNAVRPLESATGSTRDSAWRCFPYSTHHRMMQGCRSLSHTRNQPSRWGGGRTLPSPPGFQLIGFRGFPYSPDECHTPHYQSI